MMPVFNSSFGILFLPQLLQWGASSTTVAVLFNAFMVSWRLAGMVAATLTREFGFRRSAMTGTLLNATCLTLTAFATSPLYLFFSFSLGCGEPRLKLSITLDICIDIICTFIYRLFA